MGMFDSVYIKCPGCSGDVELQSKAGPCLLYKYTLTDAPAEILHDLMEDDDGTICPACGRLVFVGVHAKPPLAERDYSPEQRAFMLAYDVKWLRLEGEDDKNLLMGSTSAVSWDEAFLKDIRRCFPAAQYLCLYGSAGNYSGAPL